MYFSPTLSIAISYPNTAGEHGVSQWHLTGIFTLNDSLKRLVAYRKIYKILGVPEIQNIMLEPERGLDMIEGEPEKKRLALMGASTGKNFKGTTLT